MLRYLKSKIPTSFPSERHVDDTEESEHLLETTQDAVVVDRNHIVYWVFFLYGIAMLLPWNVFITASEFFMHRFAGSEYQETFQSYFSTYFTTTNLIMFVYLIWRQSANARSFDAGYPIVLNTAVFAFMTVTVMIQCEGSDYFWLVLALLTFTGATTSVFQAAVFAEASRFPPKYLQAVMSGQGIAGVAVALSSLASALASTRTSPETAAMMYFISALVITAAALVGRVVLQQQPFYRFYLGQGVKSGNNGENGHTEDDDADAGATLDTWTLIRRSRVMTCTVGYVFVVTLMLFPAITSLIKSTQSPHPPSRWLEDDMFVATHFVLFNVGDWLGRFFPLWPAFRIVRPMPLLLLSIARTVFLPLFLGCNVVVEQRQTAVWIQSDMLYFAIVTLFAVSNGWIGSLAMMAAPMQPYIRHANDKANIGTLMSFALVFGLAIGGALSFWVRALV